MEGIVAEKDSFVGNVETAALRDLDVLSTGMMSERFEVTVLDRLLLLAVELDLEPEIVNALETNRQEAKAALAEMEAILERRQGDGTVFTTE